MSRDAEAAEEAFDRQAAASRGRGGGSSFDGDAAAPRRDWRRDDDAADDAGGGHGGHLGETTVSEAASARLPSTAHVAAGAATRRSAPRDDAASVSHSSVRSSRAGSPAAVASAAASAGVHFRSPMYRSASPSRRVGKDNVVTSNLGRAPRFREQKADVPGASQPR